MERLILEKKRIDKHDFFIYAEVKNNLAVFYVKHAGFVASQVLSVTIACCTELCELLTKAWKKAEEFFKIKFTDYKSQDLDFCL